MYSILVVDDNEVFLAGIERLLAAAAEGWQVTTAVGGRQASRLMRERRFDLVITDIFMPETDGFETIGDVRKRSPSTKLIAMSGGEDLGETNFLHIAKRLGAHDILPKPFSNEILLRAVRAVLSSTTLPIAVSPDAPSADCASKTTRP